MKDFWLKSATSSLTFTDYELSSSITSGIYSDLEFASKFDNGSFYDYHLMSQMMDTTGDFSLSSSFEKTPVADFSLKTSYNHALSHVDLSLTAKYTHNAFTDLGFASSLVFFRSVDFDFESSITRTRYVDFAINSLVKTNVYSDFFLKSKTLELPHISSVSFGFESSFAIAADIPLPRFEDLESYLNPSIFSIKVGSISLKENSYNIGHLTLVNDYSLTPILSNPIDFSMTRILDLLPKRQVVGEIVFLQPQNLEGYTSKDINMSFVYKPLEPVRSGIIEFSVKRDIIDYEATFEDTLSLDVHIKKLDLKNRGIGIKVDFANQHATFKDSRYLNIASVPNEGEEVQESKVITGFKVNFYPESPASKYSIDDSWKLLFGFEYVGEFQSLPVRDLKNTNIQFLNAAATRKTIVQHLFLNTITHDIGDEAIASWYHEESYVDDISSDVGNYFTEKEKFEVFALDNLGEASSSDITLVGLMASNYSITTPESLCNGNGHTVFSEQDENAVEASGRVEGDMIIISPRYTKTIDTTDVNYQMARFKYYEIIDLVGISEGPRISIYAENNITSFSDFYGSFGISLIIDNFLNPVYYNGTFTYTDKISLLPYSTDDQRFSANLMYNGEDIYSIPDNLLVINNG